MEWLEEAEGLEELEQLELRTRSATDWMLQYNKTANTARNLAMWLERLVPQ